MRHEENLRILSAILFGCEEWQYNFIPYILEEKQPPVFLFGLAVLPCIAKFFRLLLRCKDDPRHGEHRTSPIMAKKVLILRILSTSETFFVVVLGSCSETKHFANRWQNIYHQHFIMLSSKSSLSCCQKPFIMHSTCTG